MVQPLHAAATVRGPPGLESHCRTPFENRRKSCDSLCAKPGRAASPLAAGSWNGPSDVGGCADAIRLEHGGNRSPRISGAVLRHDGLRRAGTARPTHPCTRGIARVSPGNFLWRGERSDAGGSLYRPGRRPTEAATLSLGVVRQNPCDFVRAKPGRAASPLAAGCWNGPSDVVGCADAIRPGPGGTDLRASPAPSFGMTDSGGQGLPALPIPAQGEAQGFRRTTPRS